jgi:hypothetical protein
MLDDAQRLDEPWPTTEAALRERVERLASAPDVTVLLMTVFRRVSEDTPPDDQLRLRRRIRRINLLAAELSHDLGVFVIDIDRALADIGAQNICAGHRLGGEAAAAEAGGVIAQALFDTGLDMWAPASVQAEAEQKMETEIARHRAVRRPTLGAADAAVSIGRRVQHAQLSAPAGDRAVVMLRGVLAGRVSMQDGWRILSRAVSKRGLAQSLSLAAGAARRVMLGRRG